MSRPNEGQAGPPRATATRRPLLSTFEGNNRAILQGIRDNLSHVLNKSQEEGGAPQSPGAGGEPGTPQGRRAAGGDRLSETGSSARAGAEGGHQQGAGAGAGLQTPNTSGSTAASAAHHNKRLAYNQKALASIRQALSGFHKDEPPNGTSGNTVGKNGFNEVDPQMLDKLISMGYPEEAARTILRTHGNKIDAQYLLGVGMGNKAPHPDSGRNGFNKTHAGLAPYPRPVTRKPSFEEKYRTNSPVNSENSSVRSDSPSHAQLRQNVASSAKTSATSQLFPGGHPNYSMLVPQGVGDRHTPPPLPPRGLPANDLPQEVYIDSPPYPSDAGGFKNQQLVRDMILKRTELPNNMRPQTAQGRPISNGPVTSHRGRPVSAPTHQGNHHNHLYNQQVVQGNNQIVLGNHQHLVAANQPPVMHGNNQVVYGNPGQVVSGSHGQVVQSSNMAGAEGVRHAYTQQFTRSGLNSQVPINSLERLHLHDDGSPLSSHSPSPAPTPVNQGGYRSATQTPIPQLKPVTALPCVQGIVTLQANSHEVTKPQLQEATAPLSPPIHPRQEYHQQPGRMVDEQQNYVSSVQAEVNQRQQQQQLQQQQHMSAASLHHQQQQQQLQQQQFQQQQYHQQQQQIQQQQYQQQQQQQQYLAERTQSPVDRQQYPVTRGSIQIDMQQQRYAGQAGLQGYPRGVPNPGPANPANSGRTIQINIQNQAGQQHAMHIQHHNAGYSPFGTTPLSTPRSESPVPRTLNQSPAMSVISTTSTPSTNSDIPDKPPPPYPGRGVNTPMYPHNQMRPLLEEKPPPAPPSESGSESLVSTDRDDDNSSVSSEKPPSTKPRKSVVRVMSPRPDRKPEARRRDPERCETQVQHFSPQAYKFFMEQHVENVLKSYQQREKRRLQLETEMAKVGLSDEAASQMRKMLHQKESNYIRLKRAKMDKHMFDRLKTLGIGAFGEVNLVRKIDTHILFAMKKLRKKDVLRRNQVAHVKAERDILAEAECEWVVKLYYSFQDESNLYFVMDYIPGGDMMSLLIKYGIFPEELARFYIAELVLAIESVHNMGFIHRDIKPDNILIDKDGHIKLTDFGLCTGFRWTHNSKYYQKSNHPRQDSMEPDESWIKDNCHCDKDLQKPLVRRNIRHQRCLAHSLVGTPNYIAPEVLLRSANIQTEPGGPEGYTKICDWWSVGVILYEMLVGQPPFLANTPIETQYKVIHWQETLQIPTEANMSGSARDLILKLLRSPHNRLGQQGATEMKNHPFFSAIDFKDLRQQAAPHKPQIRYPTDTSNFDPVEPERLKSSNDDTLKKEGTFENGKHPEHAFLEFTFRRFFDEGGHVYAPRHSDMDESNSPVYV